MSQVLDGCIFSLDLGFKLLADFGQLLFIRFQKLAVSGDVFIESQNLLALFLPDHAFT